MIKETETELRTDIGIRAIQVKNEVKIRNILCIIICARYLETAHRSVAKPYI